MAGAGFKTFNTGDVLTASDVNTYLMQQTVMVFASAAARTTALGANVAEGMLSYLKDTDQVEVYNGTSWVASDDPNAIQNTIVDAKGDIITATAADTPARLAVGSNNLILTADSTASTGLAWTGGWISYTPTWTAGTTNPTLGNGTLTGGYRRIGDRIDFWISLTMGSTTTYGSGSYRFSIPVAVSNADFNFGYPAVILNPGVQWYSWYMGSGVQIGSTTAFELWRNDGANSVSPTVPYTFTTNGKIIIQGSYRVA